MSEWAKAEEWTKRGKNFFVQVRHWTSPELNGELNGKTYYFPEKNNWNVYAFVYKDHPWFAKVDLSAYSWEARFPFEFHGGATLLEALRDKDGNITGLKIGDDYAHYGDEDFESHSTQEDAWMVFAEAQRLFESLESSSVLTVEEPK